MKTFLKPSRILFYLLSAVLFFFLGIIFAKISGAGKNQMLAGSAIVLGYGVVSGFLAFLAAIIAAQFLKNTTVVAFNKIGAGVLVLLWGYFAYRFKTRHPVGEKPVVPKPDRPVTAPAALNLNRQTIAQAEPIFHPVLRRKYDPPMGLESLDKGWIKWQQNGKLLISYSLFS